jgi:hypothetical protein
MFLAAGHVSMRCFDRHGPRKHLVTGLHTEAGQLLLGCQPDLRGKNEWDGVAILF